MDIVSTLKELIKKQTSSTGGRAPTMLASDDRNNSVLISGNKTERIRLRLLIEQLDHQGSTLSNTQVIYLSYLRAEDLAPILAGVAQANFSGNVGTTIGTITVPALDSTNPASSLANGNSSSSGSGGSIGGGGAANNAYTGNPGANTQGSRLGNTSSASTQNEGSTKPTVQIIAEPNTNSVIINAPISVIQILRSVIKQLDIKPAQLLIEAMVAEINRSDVVDLGIEWGMNVKTSDGASFKPGFAIINPTDQLSDFQAEIYALADDKRANILSTPSVVVLDNREAKILVGKQLNVPSTTYPNNANGTTNSGSPYTTFDRVNAALHLYVRPQITHDGGIQLQIDQGNEVVEPGTQDSDNPIFDISSIVTSVHINNGDTVVLGGLIQDSISNEEKKIPIVGDIPGIGTLFQHTNKDTEKRILMVFIRTTVLKNRRDAFQVSTAKYNRMRTEQLDFIRQQYYGKNNSDSILSPLNEANLPKPFSRPHATIVRKRT